MSDTHGQVDLAVVAAREFIFRAVDAVIHCGDIGSDMVLTEMAAMFQTLDIPVYAVLGNCDIHGDLKYFPENIGIQLMGRFGHLDLDGRKIAILHSDDKPLFDEVVESNQYDYVFYGHTHLSRDLRHKKTRLINPGAIGRGMNPSCAIVNLENDDVTFFPIARSE